MWQLLRIALVSAAVAQGGSGTAAPHQPTTEPVAQARDAVQRELAALCAAAESGDDPYFGTAMARRLEGRLAQPTSPPLSLQVQVGIRGRLGRELLRLDRPAEAVARFEEALDLARKHRLDDRLLGQLRRDLALALIQLAEEENCVLDHRATSCILPLQPDAVHRRTEHTRRAAGLYQELLTAGAADPQLRWLLNLTRLISGDGLSAVPAPWRLPEGYIPESGEALPRWRDLAAEVGVHSLDLSGGAAMEDFDGDGLLDLVSSTWDPCGSLKAFRNDGQGGFEDVTRAWGLDVQTGGLNLIHGDVDGDGRADLLILRGAWRGDHGRVRNSLLRNRLGTPGEGFEDITRSAGLDAAYPTQTAAFADYDGDGDLDLYLGHEATPELPAPSLLFENGGRGRFTDVTRRAGVANLRFAKGVTWGDYDDDGDPDLFVSNIGPNRLYRNEGDGRFTDVAPGTPLAGPEVSFATWFFDFDNDGDLDLFVADYGTPYAQVSASYLAAEGAASEGHPRIFENRGGRFVDASQRLGLRRPLLPMGANFGDLDNDGWLDLYLGTGVPDLEALMPNVMYRNRDGRSFQDVTAAGFGHLQKGHGIAFGDLDNDGDQDLFQQMGGAYPVDAYFNALYENPHQGHHWVTLRLRGVQANPTAVGARITLTVRDGERRRQIHRVVGTGGSFGSSSLQQEIGLGGARRIERLTIRWPGSGTEQTFEDVAVDRIYRVVEGRDSLEELRAPTFRLGAEPLPRDVHDPSRTPSSPDD